MRYLSSALLLLAVAAAAQDAPAPATWWKGNLHTHSLWSDGNDYPESIAAWYRDHGYHFLALSDHNVLSDHEHWVDVELADRRGNPGALARCRERFGDAWVETREQEGRTEVRLKTLPEVRAKLEQPGRFLMIQGEEITDGFAGAPIHLNASNLETVIPPQGGDSVRDVIQRDLRAVIAQEEATGRPIFAHLNHPNFGWAITAEDMAAVPEEHFFEVFNGHPSVHQRGDEHHVSVERLWDVANTLRLATLHAPPLMGMATDDSHHYHGDGHGAEPGRGWVMVRAPELSAAALIAALRIGDFYASSGVSLGDVTFDDGVLTVTIEPEEGVEYTTRFVGTRRGCDLDSEPVVDDDGKELPVTRRYSDEVGAVLAEVEGPVARYRLSGDELYVRAIVTSSRPAANPAYEGAMQQAWTQPVGWRH